MNTAEDIIMERKGSSVKMGNATAQIPSDISMLSIFANNSFIGDGEYRDDGWVYVNDKPIKKWYKKYEDIRYWEPKLSHIKELQNSYFNVAKVYEEY